jgi:hypothetical protein
MAEAEAATAGSAATVLRYRRGRTWTRRMSSAKCFLGSNKHSRHRVVGVVLGQAVLETAHVVVVCVCVSVVTLLCNLVNE